MHFRWNDNKIVASEGTRNKHMTSALEGTFGRLPYDIWVFHQTMQRSITTRSGTMKRKKAEEEEGKSKNKDCHERMQRARDAKHLRREAWRVFTADCEERGKKYAQALKDKAAATEQIYQTIDA